MKDFIKISKALSDESRVIILKLLEEKPLCVCEIQSVFDFAQPTISKHLKVLEEANLLVKEKKGLWVYYSINDLADSEIIKLTISNLKKLFNDDEKVLNAKSKIKFTCKEN